MDDTKQHRPPEWAFTFHGHLCPFMPLGYRMGMLVLQRLDVEREKDHTLHVIAELGEGHPQICLLDGIQVATGATFGKALMEKTYWGKLAATFWYPEKTPLRCSLKASFLDEFGTLAFFAHRMKGLEPSQIPEAVALEAIDWVFAQDDDTVFEVAERRDFTYSPPKGSFRRAKCSVCGEYVFERYLRMRDGQVVCIPDSGYGK